MRKRICLIVATLAAIWLIVNASSLILPTLYHIDDTYIKNLTEEIIANSSSVEDKTNAISSWIRDNTKDINDYDYRNGDLALELGPFIPLINSSKWEIKYCIRNQLNQDWIFESKCGRCGEYAYMFNRMARSVGLETRIVKSLSGWNHAWNQINDSGVWVNVEPRSGYNFPTDKYEREWGVKISCINAYNYDGNKTQVTEIYTNTSTLIVKVFSVDGKPIDKARINIKEHGSTRDVPCDCITNQEGFCEIVLGDNEYKVSIEEWHLWPISISGDVVIPRDDSVIEVSLIYDYWISVLNGCIITLLFICVLYLAYFWLYYTKS